MTSFVVSVTETSISLQMRTVHTQTNLIPSAGRFNNTLMIIIPR